MHDSYAVLGSCCDVDRRVPKSGRSDQLQTWQTFDERPRQKTPYDVLGISPDADNKTIAIAFREAAKRCTLIPIPATMRQNGSSSKFRQRAMP